MIRFNDPKILEMNTLIEKDKKMNEFSWSVAVNFPSFFKRIYKYPNKCYAIIVDCLKI